MRIQYSLQRVARTRYGRRLIAMLSIAFFLHLLVPVAFAGDPANPGDVVLNEFMNNPDDGAGDSAGEWLEIVNVTDGPLDINGWILRDFGSNLHQLDFGGPFLLEPGRYFVLCRNQATMPACDYQYSSFTMNNTSDDIVLVATGGTQVVRLTYANQDISGRSQFFVPSANPPLNGYFIENSNYGSFWQNSADQASESFLVNGIVNYGTPGAKNTQLGITGQPTAVRLVAAQANPVALPSWLLVRLWLLLALLTGWSLMRRLRIYSVANRSTKKH